MKKMKAEWISVFLAQKTARTKAGGWRMPGMMKGSKVAMGAGAGGWAPWQQVTSARSDTPVGSQEAGLWLFFFVE